MISPGVRDLEFAKTESFNTKGAALVISPRPRGPQERGVVKLPLTPAVSLYGAG